MPTLGEMRVRTTFNPSSSTVVDQIKQMTAELIDMCEMLRVTAVDDKTGTTLKSVENGRLASLAQTAYEEATMWAVKAATA